MQLEHIGDIEKRLWSSADNLRANSNFASNEYFLPVMGLIFLRHAYSRFLKVKAEIEPSLPSRGGRTRALTKEDFSRKGAIFLHPEAQFDHLVSRPDGADRAQVIIDAMERIEKDYETLRGALPKAEYQELDNDVLGQLLRTFNDAALRRADGDVFGRIYEYFLTQFADQKAHDGGEFFTPVALVQTIVNVIEPDHGRVLDPACGSGGMFVQSAHFIERMHLDPTERATFFGMEKNPTTIRLANMNLAVHRCRTLRRPHTEPYGVRERARRVRARPGRLRVGRRQFARCMGLVPPRPRRARGIRRTRPAFGGCRARPYPPSRQSQQVLSRVADGRRSSRGNPLKAVSETRGEAAGHLEAPRYFWRQAHWLQERFPDGVLRDVEGLVKLVDHDELAINDWSLTPGGYVGVAPEEDDEDFDFGQTMRDIHSELDELNAESIRLAATIKRNFEALAL